MSWDEELEALARQAKALGANVYEDAVARAVVAMSADDAALVHDVAELPEDEILELPDGRVFSLEAFYQILKVELRRLLHPH